MKNLRFWVLFMMCLVGHTVLIAQNFDKGIIWQGFSQDWNYNHRLNRMTDFVTANQSEDPFQYYLTHNAASGTGPDSAYFVQHFTVVESPDVRFQNSLTKFQFEAKEGEGQLKSYTETVALNSELMGKQHYYVVINGFDLLSLQKADKLVEFYFEVEPKAVYDSTAGLKVHFQAGMKMDCRTPECEVFKNTYFYGLDLYFTVIAFDEGFSATEGLLREDLEWDKVREIKKKSRKWFLTGKENMEVGVPAIRSFSLKMDKEHWVQSWETSVLSDHYDPASGDMAGTSTLSFMEWTEDRKEHPEFQKYSRFSLKGQGKAGMEIGIALLQFQHGKTMISKRKGGIHWKGRNEPVKTKSNNSEAFEYPSKEE